MKQYTTPDITILLPGAADLLGAATLIVVTLKGKRTIDLVKDDLTVEGETITFRLTQGQTGTLGPGTVKYEVTLGFADGTTMKTETDRFTINEALRKETL